MISDERLEEVVDGDILFTDEQRELAKELLALRKAFSEPVGTFTECKSMGYSHFVQTNGGEPLFRYRKP